MKITRENYETWFLDYLEGNLAPGDKEELLSFLSLNSDLAAQLDGEIPTFHPDLTITIDKGPLQKSAFDDKNIFDTTAIALAEGDLSPDEKVTFEKWIAMHPAKKIEVQLFAGTKLISDPNIRFQWKDSLKKRTAIVPLWAKVASVAAVVAMAILLYHPDPRPVVPVEFPQPPTAEMAEVVAVEPTAPSAKERADIQPAPLTQVTLPKHRLQSEPDIADHKQSTAMEENPRETEMELASLPSKTVVFQLVDELRQTDMAETPSQLLAEKSVPVTELLEPQLDAIRKSSDNELLSTDHLALSGLQLLAKISGPRLTAKQSNEGEVKSVSFSSKLLAFSIPVNR